MFRSFGALVGDLLAVLLFVAIGLIQHGTSLTTESIALVGWPFALGALLGHLAIRSWRAPFRLWPHGVFIWAITIAAAMAVRTLFQAGTEVSFVIVTAVTLGVLMLGWRGLALFLTRGERIAGASAAPAVRAAHAGPASPASPAPADEPEAEAGPSAEDGTADDDHSDEASRAGTDAPATAAEER
ncbi:DUF3054 domain-containing protein [Brachybacterium sp. J153]|uniref:DUF3054 domain-containing protein n=1 Tax=Brachybacterium sp. J153 TaxID=3116488 RepID=UPI002E77DBF7|nr:DUF3054 domain-containing protein [Brachybacterium sp. J153]MEE1618358.1 DUF3054 domain-containing protein [Brachybacterium sp. J153]